MPAPGTGLTRFHVFSQGDILKFPLREPVKSSRESHGRITLYSGLKSRLSRSPFRPDPTFGFQAEAA